MKKNFKREDGFLHLIVYLLIFLVFAITLYACLEMLDLIDVPEEYSVMKWISEHLDTSTVEEYEATDSSSVQNISKNVRIEIEDNKYSDSSAYSPEVQGYSSNKNSSMESAVGNQNTAFSYYNQLDDYAKIIYNELNKNLDNMKTGTYNVDFGTTFDDLLHEENGEQVLNDSFQLAVNALNFDNPETFFIDIPKLYLLTEIKTKLWGTTYSVQIGCKDGYNYLNSSFRNSEDVNIAINNVRQVRNSIKDSLNGNSDENKIRAVHDYLVDNLEYDSSVSKDNIYNIYGALINKLTVCEGYARAFKYIMDDLGIECIIACGTAVNSTGATESHAWNYVKLDGNWYAMDVTWDDPVVIGNGYLDRSTHYKYYLKGSNDFFTNHTEKGDIVGDVSFKYPTISVNNY